MTTYSSTVNGSTLYVEIAGEGPPVVLVHGFSLDHRMWDDQFGILSAGHRTVRYDLRGFGKSAIPGTARYSHADDLAAMLDRFEIKRATIVGLSMGGEIALDFSLKYPERISGLIVVDSILRGFRWSLEWRSSLNEINELARSSGIRLAKDRWLAHPLFGPARERPAIRERLSEMLELYSGWHWTHADPAAAAARPDIERLGEIDSPTLVVVGERDLRDFRKISEILRREIPGAEFSNIPNVGHMSNMEGPSAFNRNLLDFLSRLR